MSEQQNVQASRRDFLKTTTAAVVGGTLVSTANITGAWAAGSDEIRVGVIGCGGRGTGAVENAHQLGGRRPPRRGGRPLPRSPRRRASRT